MQGTPLVSKIDLSMLRASPVALASSDRAVSLNADVSGLLSANAVVAVGVSGGKDSVACALAVACHLDAIGHTGPRVLIHADLGRVEWKDSGPACERLAARLGWELMTVRRQAGDMLARWEKRWENNVTRYRDLSCVRVILPWSTPSLRFCTSELKTSVITSALKKRFPNQHIINVTGVRREESAARSKMPTSAPMAALTRRGYVGVAWNAIIDWPVADVFAEIESAGLQLHEAYTRYGASRVSCAFCIMSSMSDLMAAAGCTDNHDLYREMVALEARSTFAFQGQRWLADVAPNLLCDALKVDVERAKRSGEQRRAIESRIPKHLLFTAGWPTVRPTLDEAELLARVRADVSSLLNLDVQHTSASTVLARYDSLLALRGDQTVETATIETAQSEFAF